MAKTGVRSTGVQVEGLSASVRALGRINKEARKEAVEIFRAEAKIVQLKAKARAHTDPAAPGNASWIGRSATGKGAGVKLIGHKGDQRAHAAEWGMHKWQLRTWGGGIRGYIQSAMKRRTFRPWSGNRFDVKGRSGPGHVIQPAIRDHLPGMEVRVANQMQALFRRELDKAGVKRG